MCVYSHVDIYIYVKIYTVCVYAPVYVELMWGVNSYSASGSDVHVCICTCGYIHICRNIHTSWGDAKHQLHVSISRRRHKPMSCKDKNFRWKSLLPWMKTNAIGALKVGIVFAHTLWDFNYAWVKPNFFQMKLSAAPLARQYLMTMPRTNELKDKKFRWKPLLSRMKTNAVLALKVGIVCSHTLWDVNYAWDKPIFF